MSNQVEHSDFLCLLLIIYFIIRISFFNYLAKILLGQPLLFVMLFYSAYMQLCHPYQIGQENAQFRHQRIIML